MKSHEEQIKPKRKIKVGRPKKTGAPGRPANRYRSFGQARVFARRQRLSTIQEWKDYVKSGKLPDDIPIRPDRSYSAYWLGWKDWLGCYYIDFEEARATVRQYKIASKVLYFDKWEELFTRPVTIPKRPDLYYKGEWKGWEDWLGVKRIVNRKNHGPYMVANLTPFKKGTHYRPFNEAVRFVSGLGLKDHVDWLRWRGTYDKKDLPWRPDEVYANEWKGWSIFLGHNPLPALLENVSVLFIAQQPGDPSNVFRIEVYPNGKAELMHRATREGFKVLRIWNYDPMLKADVDEVLRVNTSSYYGSDEIFIVPNIYGLYGDLFNWLMVVT